MLAPIFTPAPSPTPQSEVAGEVVVSLLSPTPIVRIVGRLTAKGADVTRLSVQTPPGVRIVVRCVGRKCPFARRTTIVPASRKKVVTVRVRNIERTYAAGVKLGVSIERRGTIGKFTRFVIRKGKAPRRKDACVAYGRSRARSCPDAGASVAKASTSVWRPAPR